MNISTIRPLLGQNSRPPSDAPEQVLQTLEVGGVGIRRFRPYKWVSEETRQPTPIEIARDYLKRLTREASAFGPVDIQFKGRKPLTKAEEFPYGKPLRPPFAGPLVKTVQSIQPQLIIQGGKTYELVLIGRKTCKREVTTGRRRSVTKIAA